jgi:hypothetical protein
MNVSTFPLINASYLSNSEFRNSERGVFPKHVDVTAAVGKMSVKKFTIILFCFIIFSFNKIHSELISHYSHFISTLYQPHLEYVPYSKTNFYILAGKSTYSVLSVIASQLFPLHSLL